MNSHRKPLLVAAVLSGALSALAESPDRRGLGDGSSSPDPSNESWLNNASGARAAGATNARIGVGYTDPTGPNFQRANEAEPPNAPVSAPAGEASRPKHKRTFWDVLFGRNKHEGADAGQVDNPPTPGLK